MVQESILLPYGSLSQQCTYPPQTMFRKNSIVPMQLEEFRLRLVENMTKKYANET